MHSEEEFPNFHYERVPESCERLKLKQTLPSVFKCGVHCLLMEQLICFMSTESYRLNDDLLASDWLYIRLMIQTAKKEMKVWIFLIVSHKNKVKFRLHCFERESPGSTSKSAGKIDFIVALSITQYHKKN